MSYYNISNFRAGLDTRRDILAAQAGTLVTLRNCHITQGGEVEKRKAFVRTAMPVETYGLEDTDTGLVTFGSRPGTKTSTRRERTANVAKVTLGTDHGFLVGDVISTVGTLNTSYNSASVTISAVTSTTISYPSVGAPNPEGDTADATIVVTLLVAGGTIDYIRLQHPAMLANVPATYDATKHAMTEALASRNFQGASLVIAKFADGASYLYDDGVLVLQSASGIMQPGWGAQAVINNNIAQQIEDQFNAQPGWAALVGAISDVWVNPPADVIYYTVKSPDTETFTITYNNTTVGGLMADLSTGDVAATSGVAGFVTTAITGVVGDLFAFWAPLYPGDTVGVWLTPSAGVPYNAAGDASTADDIVAAIVARFDIHGFTATHPSAANVKIEAPIPASEFAAAYNQGSLRYIKTHLAVPTTTTTAFSGGVTSVHAWGEQVYGYVAGPWLVATPYTASDTWQLNVTGAAYDFVIGIGLINRGSLAAMTNVFVDKDTAYLANILQFNFSALNDPSGWETYNTGAGFLPYTSQFGSQDTVQTFESYQGKLAVFGRRSIQIWATPADPTDYVLEQVLTNIGTLARFSAAGLGDLDVFFLADTGIRSLKVKNITLNGYVEDVGSPIDLMLRAVLTNPAITDATKAAACGIIEPTENRYWLFLNDTIYVLSYFPVSKTVAWSTYAPTYSGDASTFVPQKFVVSDLQVFARSSDAIYAFGGSNGDTYDACTATLQTPFQSGGGGVDKPATWKTAKGIDIIMQGAWVLKASMDWVNPVTSLETVYDASQSSYDGGRIPFQSKGTHFSLLATTVATSAARVCSLVFHFEDSEETA